MLAKQKEEEQSSSAAYSYDIPAIRLRTGFAKNRPAEARILNLGSARRREREKEQKFYYLGGSARQPFRRRKGSKGKHL